MKARANSVSKVVSYSVYVIQAIYDHDDGNSHWTIYSWSLFAKVPHHTTTGRRGEYFIQTDEGRAFLNHKDRPAHYYGERFWHDVPAFMTEETAVACMRAIVDGGWAEGRLLRVARLSRVEALEEVARA